MAYAMMGAMAEPVGGRLSAALRETYERAGVSQVQMAERLGVDQPTISRWVRGMRRPPLEVLGDIEALCEVPKGTILRLAGYVVDHPGDVIAAIASAPDLDEHGKRIMTTLYGELRQQTAPGQFRDPAPVT